MKVKRYSDLINEAVDSKSKKFVEIADYGDEQLYKRYFGNVVIWDEKKEKDVEIDLYAIATIQDLYHAVSEDELPEEGNFQLTFTLYPEEKFISKTLIKKAQADTGKSGDVHADLVPYMHGLRFEPNDKYFFKTKKTAENYLMSSKLNDKITGMGVMSGFVMDMHYNRIGETNWEHLKKIMEYK